MVRKYVSMGVFSLLGIIELGDFIGVVTTLFRVSNLTAAAESLGITFEQQAARLVVLFLLTLVIAILCFITAWGFYRNNWWLKNVYRLASASLMVYAVFHVVTALTIPAVSLAWILAGAFFVAAVATFVIGLWAV
jgi:hypothetical protein